jgi:hypothetical protein
MTENWTRHVTRYQWSQFPRFSVCPPTDGRIGLFRTTVLIFTLLYIIQSTLHKSQSYRYMFRLNKSSSGVSKNHKTNYNTPVHIWDPRWLTMCFGIRKWRDSYVLLYLRDVCAASWGSCSRGHGYVRRGFAVTPSIHVDTTVHRNNVICESQHTLWAIWDPKCAQAYRN